MNGSINKVKRTLRNTVPWGKIIFIGFYIFAFVWSIYEICLQHYIIRVYQPVEARIIKSDMKLKIWAKGLHHYKPKIEYQYQVGGKIYTSTKIYMVPDDHGDLEEVIARLVGRYHKGSTHTAYYNPHDPEAVVLTKECQFLPYGVFFIGHFAVWFCGLFFLPGTSRPFKLDRPARARDRGDGWYDLEGISEKAGEIRMLLGAGLLYMGITFLMWVHYNYLWPKHGLGPDIGTMFGAAPGLVPIGLGIQSWRQRLREIPRLAVDTNPIVSGSGFSIWIYWPVTAVTQVHIFQAGLVKDTIIPQYTRWNPRRFRCHKKKILTETTCQPGEDVVQEIGFHIPSGKRPKTNPQGKPRWRSRWQVEVVIEADRKKERWLYPLPVECTKGTENS